MSPYGVGPSIVKNRPQSRNHWKTGWASAQLFSVNRIGLSPKTGMSLQSPSLNFMHAHVFFVKPALPGHKSGIKIIFDHFRNGRARYEECKNEGDRRLTYEASFVEYEVLFLQYSMKLMHCVMNVLFFGRVCHNKAPACEYQYNHLRRTHLQIKAGNCPGS